jgi:hypothetical protein
MKLKMARSVVRVICLFQTNIPISVTFQVPTLAVMKTALFWNVTTCVSVCSRQGFRGTEPWCFSEMSLPMYQTATRCHIPEDHMMNYNFCYNRPLLGGSRSWCEGGMKMDLQEVRFLKSGLDSCGWWLCRIAGFCESGNEPLGSKYVGKFLYGLIDYQLVSMEGILLIYNSVLVAGFCEHGYAPLGRA